MKAIIDYNYTTEINQEQTKILFKDNYYEILTDQEGEFYFMYEDSVVYFQIVEEDFLGWNEEQINETIS